MKTICTCGFDYGDFVTHHQIPAGAKFNCPGCDIEMQTEVSPSAGTPVPACHEGLVYSALTPPLPAAIPLAELAHPLMPCAAHESFHGISGM